MTQLQTDMMSRLDRVERIATGSRMGRFLYSPIHYVRGLWHTRMVYPFTVRGLLAHVSTFFGAEMQVLLPAGLDIYITGAKTHSSEIRLARLLTRELQPGSTYLDIGSHFGYFALLSARLVGDTGRVFAFEASGGTYTLLSANSSPYPNIETIHAAVSDSPQPLTFYEFPVLYSEYNSMEIDQYRGQQWFESNQPTRKEVQSIILDQFITSRHITPTLAKIDVEGAEDVVVRGGVDTLHAAHTIVVMEYLAHERGNDAHLRADAILTDRGYLRYSIGHDGSLIPCDDVQAHLRLLGLDSDNIVFKLPD